MSLGQTLKPPRQEDGKDNSSTAQLETDVDTGKPAEATPDTKKAKTSADDEDVSREEKSEGSSSEVPIRNVAGSAQESVPDTEEAAQGLLRRSKRKRKKPQWYVALLEWSRDAWSTADAEERDESSLNQLD